MEYVIIGGSAAGVAASEAIRKNDKKSPITLISDESFPLYSRCLLTYLMAGAIDEGKLNFKDKTFYKDNNIKTFLGRKAVSIDPKEKVVVLEDRTKISYDRLLISTGASAKTLDAPGADKKGVFTVRTIEDARSIMRTLDSVKGVAVLGGGLIGLKDAYALRQRQKKVAVIVKSPQLLSQMVDADAARIVALHLEKNGIEIMTGLEAKEILGRKAVEGILLDNDEKLECQLVIVGKGVTPNTGLASSCGIKVLEGIEVDDFLRTSEKDIFAAGDVAQTFDIARGAKRINALWPCAVEQGKIAGLNMAGKKTAYDGSLSMNSVDFFGLSAISMGITKPQGEGYDIILKTRKGSYRKFILKDNRVVGVVLVGDIDLAGTVGILIKGKVDISAIKQELTKDNFDYAKIMPLVKEFEEKFKEDEFKDTIITY